MTTPSYRTAVARVFAGLDPEPIYNGTIEHARVIVEEGFKAADHEVRLLTHALDTLCYGDPAVLGAAKRFLGRPEARLSILVEDPSALTKCHKVIEELQAAGRERVSIKLVPDALVDMYDYNLMVVDEKGYRFEANREEHQAVVAGGPANTDHLRRLSRVFDYLAQQSAPADRVLVAA